MSQHRLIHRRCKVLAGEGLLGSGHELYSFCRAAVLHQKCGEHRELTRPVVPRNPLQIHVWPLPLTELAQALLAFDRQTERPFGVEKTVRLLVEPRTDQLGLSREVEPAGTLGVELRNLDEQLRSQRTLAKPLVDG